MHLQSLHTHSLYDDGRSTIEDKLQSAEFEGSQAGLDAAAAWLREQYEAAVPRWPNIPSILDCEPDR